MTKQYTAIDLIEAAKSYIAADAAIMTDRPAGCPRGAWRMENPINLPISFKALDATFRTKPSRTLSFDLNGNPFDLWIWSTGKHPHVLGRINLRAADADTQLSRYVRG
jgi:hypothetical protein